ncbi:MAG: helix-turn-helix domain-containing protein [Eubacteriales bacterium]
MELLTIKEVSDQLRISEYTIAAWLRSGKLKGNRLAGRFWRVSKESLQEFIKEGGVIKN